MEWSSQEDSNDGGCFGLSQEIEIEDVEKDKEKPAGWEKSTVEKAVCREGLETEVPKQGEKLNEADTSESVDEVMAQPKRQLQT